MKRLRLWLICIVILVTMSACNGGGTETEPVSTLESVASSAEESEVLTTEEPATEEPTTEAPTTEAVLTAQEVYDQAISALNALGSMQLEINVETVTVLGANSFDEKNTQTLVLQNMGEETFVAKLSDKTYRGTYYTQTEEIFSGGSMYFSIRQVGVKDKVDYVTEMTAEEYLDRMIPAELLEFELYESVEMSGNTLIFSDGLGAEAWIGLGDTEVMEASGKVILDDDGTIKTSEYSLVYELNSAVVTMEVSVDVMADTGAEISVPTSVEGYTLLEGQSYLGPYLIHHAIGYINQMNTISSHSGVSAISAASGWVYGADETSHLYDDGERVVANITNHVQLADINTGEYYFDDTVVESYEDGVYTYIYNDGVPESQPLDFVQLSRGVNAQILADIPELMTIERLEVGVYSGMLLVEYSYSSDVGAEMCVAVAGLMYADPNLLNSVSSAYRTDVAGGYIGIDIATGIPTSVGVEYTGIHTIEGAEYALTYKMDRNFLVGDASTYKEITGEALPKPDREEEPITPLFYKVTGNSGQQMWLLGTIHVGDSRTTQLPTQIMEAFDGADALAVEFDTEAFSQRLEEDVEFATRVYQLYMYMDGSTTESHISDPELYTYAVKTMKAAGLLGPYTMQMKAASWSQDIENFYKQWSREMSGDYGVDSRLLELAREQQKKILDIESGMEQVGMLMGFSDDLQELLLAESLSYGAATYGESMHNLFEMWCEGDEAALTEYLNETDTSEMTPEEKVLYEEYVKAMETDRNLNMYMKALGYLESDEVVFYAVGLAHLLAEDGLVNTLREAGYTVEAVGY